MPNETPNQITDIQHGPLYQCGWDETPHITDEMKQQMLMSISPHMRDARTKGIPSVGTGQIFPIPRDRYEVEPFDIPPHWERCYGLDVGWNRTAAVFLAWDKESDTLYAYAEYYQAKMEPTDHTKGITAEAGDWMIGAIDPSAAGSSQRDGRSLMDEYINLGLQVEKANNAVETGLATMWRRFVGGKLKIFANCTNLLRELSVYRRNDKGRIVKADDHATDALRYGIMTGASILTLKINQDEEDDLANEFLARQMSRNRTTGY